MVFEAAARFLPGAEVVCALIATTALAGTALQDRRPHQMSYDQELLAIESSQLKWLGPLSPSTEARVRPVLDHAFETSPGVIAPYRLACDMDDCSLIVDARVVDPGWWMPRFQEQVSQAGISNGMLIGADHAFFSVPDR
jgi:hypothetical protein